MVTMGKQDVLPFSYTLSIVGLLSEVNITWLANWDGTQPLKAVKASLEFSTAVRYIGSDEGRWR